MVAMPRRPFWLLRVSLARRLGRVFVARWGLVFERNSPITARNRWVCSHVGVYVLTISVYALTMSGFASAMGHFSPAMGHFDTTAGVYALTMAGYALTPG